MSALRCSVAGPLRPVSGFSYPGSLPPVTGEEVASSWAGKLCIPGIPLPRLWHPPRSLSTLQLLPLPIQMLPSRSLGLHLWPLSILSSGRSHFLFLPFPANVEGATPLPLALCNTASISSAPWSCSPPREPFLNCGAQHLPSQSLLKGCLQPPMLSALGRLVFPSSLLDVSLSQSHLLSAC